MPAEVKYRPEGNYVYMRVRGALVAATAMKMIQQWMALEREHQCLRVLTDYREAEIGETITGMYEFVGKMDALGIPRDMKMACVNRNDSENHLFFETVAQNQGWQYRLFDSLEEAASWLVEE